MLPYITNNMIFNCPLMITQAKLFEILNFLGPRIGIGDFSAAKSKQFTPISSPEYRKENGLAIVPVFGTLMHRNMGISNASGLTNYQGLRAELYDALQDPNVKSILLDIDSNGGEVAGVFSLADEIHRARGQKRIIAIANEAAYSAAYLLGSAAGEFYLSRTAGMGSIGVIALFVDKSKQDERQGLKYTTIYRGARKIDLSPHYPITDEAMKEVQVKVDAVYDLFISTVARNRGMPEKAVRDTEAGMFMGDQAVKAGLADGVKDFSEVLSYGKGETMFMSHTITNSQQSEPEISPLVADAMQRAEFLGVGADISQEEIENNPLVKNAMERAGKSETENSLIENARRRALGLN